jgi:superfamily I DNA and/or RNA helicase
MFYRGDLKSGISPEQRTEYKNLQDGIFVKGDPRLFVNVNGKEVKVGDSYKNDEEIRFVLACLNYLVSKYKNVMQESIPTIGVISNYRL